MSTETILSAYTRGTHTHTHTDRGTRTHEHSDYTKLTLHSLKRTANSDFTAMDEDNVYKDCWSNGCISKTELNEYRQYCTRIPEILHD